MVTEDQPFGIVELAVDELVGPDGIDGRLPGAEEFPDPGSTLGTALLAHPIREPFYLDAVLWLEEPQQGIVSISIFVTGVVKIGHELVVFVMAEGIIRVAVTLDAGEGS